MACALANLPPWGSKGAYGIKGGPFNPMMPARCASLGHPRRTRSKATFNLRKYRTLKGLVQVKVTSLESFVHYRSDGNQPLEGAPVRRLIFWWPRTKLADLDLPPQEPREECPKGCKQGIPYPPPHFEGCESILYI